MIPVIVTIVAITGIGVIAFALWALIFPVPVEDDPVEIEEPRDDRWGHHGAMEDREP